MCVCVCVCVRERERERESIYLYIKLEFLGCVHGLSGDDQKRSPINKKRNADEPEHSNDEEDVDFIGLVVLSIIRILSGKKCYHESHLCHIYQPIGQEEPPILQVLRIMKRVVSAAASLCSLSSTKAPRAHSHYVKAYG